MAVAREVNQLKIGSLLSYVQMGLGAVVSLAFTPVMLRLLGQSEYGLYTLVNGFVSNLSLLSFGMGSAYMRYYSRAEAQDGEDGVARINGMFMTIFFAISLLCLLTGGVLVANVKNIFAAKLTAKELDTAKILMALLADGHVLLDDIPGVGKTTLAVALSRTLGLTYNRIQFTPDVLPSDIVGFSIYNKDSGCFEYKSGVVSNTNLLLGDEINRTSSKTQSALLEAMEERQVTVDGTTYPLQKPFAVIATQNNVGTAGTQLLPYAQMDRFLVRLSIGYPDYEAQMSILRDRQSTDPIGSVAQVVTRDDVLRMQAEVRAVTAKDSILDYITRLAMASREHPMVEVGISPRGTLFLDRMAKAHAYLEGRDYVTGGDVQAIFHDVCAHRVILNQKSRLSGGTVTQVLNELLETVEVPDRRQA